MTENISPLFFSRLKKSLFVTDRLDWIFKIILLGLLFQMLLSLSLWWTTNGTLPYLPIFNSDGQWLERFSLILFPAFLLLIFLNFIFSANRKWLCLLLIVGLLLVLGNIHRLQVWFYLYGLLLFLFLWKDKVSAAGILMVLQRVVAGVYIWSGLHKFNMDFVETIFPWLMEPLGWITIQEVAYLAAGVEVLIGIGLLFRSTRHFFLIGSCIFHLSILGLLGPLGHNWNMVVWPWNLVMPLLGFFLFFKTEDIKLVDGESFFRVFPAGNFVLILIWVFPAFNYLEVTPEQLSFKMYSGSQPEIVLYFGEKDRGLVGKHPTVYGVLPSKNLPNYRVVLDDLAFAEWGTPMFITQNTARRILQQFCQTMERPTEGGMLYLWNDEFIEIPCVEGK